MGETGADGRDREGDRSAEGYRVVTSARRKATASTKTSSIRENRGKGDISGGATRYEGFGGKPPSPARKTAQKRPSPVTSAR